MPKTTLVVAVRYRSGDNVFALISPVYLALKNSGSPDLAEEMQTKIDTTAKSPADVEKIVKEYVTVRHG